MWATLKKSFILKSPPGKNFLPQGSLLLEAILL